MKKGEEELAKVPCFLQQDMWNRLFSHDLQTIPAGKQGSKLATCCDCSVYGGSHLTC